MAEASQSIPRRVQELVEPVLVELGFELVDTEYVSIHGRWILRLYIDREGGVTIDDCALASREVGDLIEVKDIIKGQYTLEVSSPGLNRPLTKEKDLMRALGKKVKIKTKISLNGRSNFTGVLHAFREGRLQIDIENQRVELPWSDIKKANLVYEFEE